MSKHTPGPWATYSGEGLPIAVVSNGDKNLNKRLVLAMVGDPHVSKNLTDEEKKANADLICQAPEMLETLKEQAGAQAKIFMLLNSYAKNEHMKEWSRVSLEGIIAQVYGDLAAGHERLKTTIKKAERGRWAK